MTPEQVDMVRAGLPLNVPSFTRALETRQPVFIDGWNAAREQIENTDVFGPVCIYPVVGQEVRGIFTVGLRLGEQWQSRDRGLMRALGRSLTLAVERGEGARQQAEQNAELLARTRALEAFETLSHELDSAARLLVGRSLEIMLSQMPPGFAMSYEHENGEGGDGLFRIRAQVGSMRNDDLQRAVDAGLPYRSTLNLRRPLETGQAHYQDHDRLDTDRLGEMDSHLGATAALPILVSQQVRGVLALALFKEDKDLDRH
ncbi:hypothetical protein [Deinococcus humi]|uniref:GAF domain-containing protein n=1 Tax=Deinococcus humi TaxID=662880 RepID=A0A7W8JTP3_9DEIO|nr:hypothetical protein [Deinococcus humi]MBB5363035.1 GAF domain-containing protein [Deinococcus humi]GGO25012.1 hypothetical protein GCM10008949_14480 [Deinococcus humi]